MKDRQEEFNAMVNRLFKVDGFHHKYDGLLHAVIGLAGEVDELREALINDDRENIIEELGDFKFYHQAAIAQIELTGECDPALLKEANSCITNSAVKTFAPKIEYASDICCAALDEIKRGWVYGKTINYEDLLATLVGIISVINRIADDFEISSKDILASNMHKLENVDTGRYREGEYTDRAAIDRRDKCVN